MVTTGSTYGHYSGRTNHTLTLNIQRAAVGGNQSYFNWQLIATRNSGAVSYGLDCYNYSVWVAGQNWTGCHNLDFRNTSTITVASGYTQWVSHDGNGDLNIWIDASHTTNSVLGSADTAGTWLAIDRIAKVPNAPSLNTIWAVTTNSFQVNWNTPADNGSTIDMWEHQWDDNPTFPSPLVWQDIWNGNYTNPSGQVALLPGTTYYVRAHARNGVGWGAFGPTVSQTTLPSSPPGLSIAADPSGKSATLSMTSPGGVTGVTSYSIERRTLGSTTVTPYSTPTSPYTVEGLTPGTTYEWRASAWIGTYQSPWSSWQALIQPNPNTNPGDYFDGSTPAKPDQVYSWTGAVGNSTSIATGDVPQGWLAFGTGNPTAGATGSVMQVTGGVSGLYAARTMFYSDQTTPGFLVGTDFALPALADVTPRATYVGSIYVNPSKTTRGSAVISWRTAAGAALSTSVGEASEVGPGAFRRFTVTAVAPDTAEFASVAWADSVGTGHALWLGGDSIIADAAMLSLSELFPYFDGDTPDAGGYDYEWIGLPNASISTRTQTATADEVDPLQDPDCPPVPAPPRPPTVPSDCIEDIGVWRRYWASIPASEVSDWLTVLPTMELETQAAAARQVRVRMYANPFEYPSSLVDTSVWCSEQIISYIPPNTLFTLDGMTQRAWAEVAGGAARTADHLVYGSNGTPSTWPHLSCGISYLVSFDVPLDAPEGNIKPSVYLTQRT